MKIESHEIIVADVSLERPFMAAGRVPSSALRHIVLKLRTDDGIEGLGWAFSHSHTMLPALRSAIDDVATLVRGRDPLMRGAIQREIDRTTWWAGAGFPEWVSAVINIALWDIAGKALGQPVYRLLGGQRGDAVPTYASGHLWRDWTLDELAEGAGMLKDRGFKALKFRCGSLEKASDEGERARVVREAVGDGFPIMVDINQGWDVPRTMEVGRYFEKYGIYWLEDPIDHRDLAGYRRLMGALDLTITHGEYQYGFEPFSRIVEAEAFDIAMIDAHHAGGIDAWKKAAAICEGAQRPVVSHLSPEIAVHLGASTANCQTVEYMPWSFGLFEESMEINPDGELIVPQAPGLGVTLNEETVRRGAVDW